MKRPAAIKLDDPKAEQVRAAHHTAIADLQAMPAAAMVIVPNITLSSVWRSVPHGLGRRPAFIGTSMMRNIPTPNAGVLVEDHTDPSVDYTKYVVVSYQGGSGPVVVDLLVM